MMSSWLRQVLFYSVLCSSFIALGQNRELSNYIPDSFIIQEVLSGDLNNDGEEDCVLIIKDTNDDQVVVNRFNKLVDRNRRGIIILLSVNDGYQIASSNYDCFESENEDGGVYFPPVLTASIANQKLYIHYSHGRYGWWKYTFRKQDADFALIGYDNSYNRGPIVQKLTSINFLTHKKIVRENLNKNSQSNKDSFKESVEMIKKEKLIRLSKIKDFSDLNFES